MTDTDTFTQDTRKFQAHQMRSVAQGIRDYAEELTRATRVEEFTHVAWHLHRTYSLVNRLTECFYDHETHALDMPSIARWRKGLYRVTHQHVRALTEVHYMEFHALTHGTEDWRRYANSIVSMLTNSAAALYVMADQWTEEYLTPNSTGSVS